MATGADLVKYSLLDIGAIAAGETPSAAEQADALVILNDIIEEWSNDGFMIHEKKIEEFTLTSGDGTYSIGTGGDFSTTRPINILGATLKVATSGIELPLKIWNYQQWMGIRLKTTQSTLPEGIYYNPTYPLGEINFWCVPSEANKLVLCSLKPLSSVAAATTLSYPPGYKSALQLNLSKRLCRPFGRPLTQDLIDDAREAKAGIQRTNTEPVYLQSDAYGLNEGVNYDILTGPE